MTLALPQEPQPEEFITSTELGRNIETNMNALLSKLDNLEKSILKSIDNVSVGMDKLEQSILETEAREAAATSALLKEEEAYEGAVDPLSPKPEDKS